MARPTMADAPEKAREKPETTAFGSRPSMAFPMPLRCETAPVARDLKEPPMAVAALLSGAGVKEATFLRAEDSLDVDDAAESWADLRASLAAFRRSSAPLHAELEASSLRRADASRSPAATACVEPSPDLATASASLISATRTLPASSAILERALESCEVALATSRRNGASASSDIPFEDFEKAAFSDEPSVLPELAPADRQADPAPLLTDDLKPFIEGTMAMCALPSSELMWPP